LDGTATVVVFCLFGEVGHVFSDLKLLGTHLDAFSSTRALTRDMRSRRLGCPSLPKHVENWEGILFNGCQRGDSPDRPTTRVCPVCPNVLVDAARRMASGETAIAQRPHSHIRLPIPHTHRSRTQSRSLQRTALSPPHRRPTLRNYSTPQAISERSQGSWRALILNRRLTIHAPSGMFLVTAGGLSEE